jgi:hypothetical protein
MLNHSLLFIKCFLALRFLSGRTLHSMAQCLSAPTSTASRSGLLPGLAGAYFPPWTLLCSGTATRSCGCQLARPSGLSWIRWLNFQATLNTSSVSVPPSILNKAPCRPACDKHQLRSCRVLSMSILRGSFYSRPANHRGAWQPIAFKKCRGSWSEPRSMMSARSHGG